MRAKSRSTFSKIHERNWRARYGFWPIFATKSFRASGERPRRSNIADFQLPTCPPQPRRRRISE